MKWVFGEDSFIPVAKIRMGFLRIGKKGNLCMFSIFRYLMF